MGVAVVEVDDALVHGRFSAGWFGATLAPRRTAFTREQYLLEELPTRCASRFAIYQVPAVEGRHNPLAQSQGP